MPRILCRECARYTQQYGCKLQNQNYWQFRDCMLEVKDYSWPKDGTDQEQQHPKTDEEGAADD